LLKQREERGRPSSQKKVKPAPGVGSTRSVASLDFARLQMVPYMKTVKSAQRVDAVMAQTTSLMISPMSYLYDEAMKQRALQLQRWVQRPAHVRPEPRVEMLQHIFSSSSSKRLCGYR
jgi:hypothetical protein